jgi:hypothetical protein
MLLFQQGVERRCRLFPQLLMAADATGVQGEATKQIGNAFPPVVAEKLYRTIAKTLEAFDNNHIDAEEDLDVFSCAVDNFRRCVAGFFKASLGRR